MDANGGEPTIFSVNLVQLRVQKLLTQEALATEAGISLSTVKQWEGAGSAKASLRSLRKVAIAVRMEPEELIARLCTPPTVNDARRRIARQIPGVRTGAELERAPKQAASKRKK